MKNIHIFLLHCIIFVLTCSKRFYKTITNDLEVIMNTIIKEVEKNIRKVKTIGKAVRKIENELFNYTLKWPPKTY